MPYLTDSYVLVRTAYRTGNVIAQSDKRKLELFRKILAVYVVIKTFLLVGSIVRVLILRHSRRTFRLRPVCPPTIAAELSWLDARMPKAFLSLPESTY